VDRVIERVGDVREYKESVLLERGKQERVSRSEQTERWRQEWVTGVSEKAEQTEIYKSWGEKKGEE
jgi:hypothetical protein